MGCQQMNASRLREVLELLIFCENQFGIQKKFSDFHKALAALAGNTQEQSLQQNFNTTFQDLSKSVCTMAATFQPSQVDLFEEIGADKYFVHNFPNDITQYIQENPITPTVSLQHVQILLTERAKFIETINQLVTNLDALGVVASELQEGSAEIGFLIPHELFDNEFDSLLKRLGTINNIIRFFSVIATGSAEIVEVRSISTSDPLFFFGVDASTVALLGGAVTWALHTWKQVEEIRSLRADAKKLDIFTEGDMKVFDTKIQDIVKQAVEDHVDQVLHIPEGRASTRRQEEKNNITWALETLLSFVERGMKVEIRYIPPKTAGETEDGDGTASSPIFSKLGDIAPKLDFPRVVGTPVLEIPSIEPPKSSRSSPSKEGNN